MLLINLKCIFVHVPKTAGQSIERSLLKYCGSSWDRRGPFLLRKNDNPDLGPPRLAHLTTREYMSCGHVTHEEFADYFKFSFVRNPWARLVSEYRALGLASECSFQDWVLNRFPEPGWSDAYRHVMPQVSYLYGEAEESLVDFIGRFENLEADFSKVRQLTDLSLPDLELTNTSHNSGFRLVGWRKVANKFNSLAAKQARVASAKQASRDYRTYYDQETYDFVVDYYREDIERFSYTFGA